MTSNAQRALWTVLFYSLVGPFFAALAVAGALALAPLLGLAARLPQDLLPLGQAVMMSFVWSAVPATAAGLVLGAIVLRTGGIRWVVAAAVGVIAFALAALLLPIGLEELRPFLAFLAGLAAIAVRDVLVRAGILAA